ncbi:MAG: hypothetical protein AAF802_09830 [Planctomycetota bacterium]
MALPDELLDELLSAHLDGVTSDDERARVEAMLRDDASVRERMQHLENDRDAVRKAMGGRVSAPDSILAMTMQSIAEQAPAVSPAAASESTGFGSAGNRHRPLIWIAAVAASMLFVAWIASRGFDHADEPTPIAEVEQDGNPEPKLPEDRIAAANVAEDEAIEATSDGPIGDVADPSADERRMEPMLVESGVPSPGEASMPISPTLVEGEKDSRGAKIAMDASPDSREVAELPNLMPGVQSLRFLMVVSIERTEQGRDSDAFTRALADANIEVGEERPVSEALVGAAMAGKSEPAAGRDLAGESPEVLLLESPAKKLDLLVQRLARDRENISSVGLNLITSQDEALISVYDAVCASDPTQVRHQGRTVPLKGDSDVFDVWTSALAGRDFRPIESAEGLTIGMSGSEVGEDPMSNLLLLVK